MDIVLVPGLWLDGPSWGEVTIRLEAAGHRVRALTLPGLQQAGTEDARTLGDVTLPEQVDAVTRAIDWCADPVLLVGHSAGAGVAWAAADARPDWVARLVLIGGFPTPHGEPLVEGLAVVDGAVPFPGFDAFDTSETGDLDEATRAAIAARALPSPACAVTGTQQLHDERRYDIPVTVLCPEFTPEQLRSWVDAGAPPVQEFTRIRHLDLVDIPTGHWPQFSAPGLLADALLACIPDLPDPLEHVRLRGRALRSRDLRGASIANSWIDGMRIDGEFEHLWVNDVDVAAFVQGVLDERQPELVIVRDMQTADEYRAAWERLEAMWAATVERVQAMPDGTADRRVRGEWSFTETLRHLVFATDCWLRAAMQGRSDAFHPWGINHTEMGDTFADQIGLRRHEHPTLDEVLAVRADRMGQVRAVLAALTDADMATMSLQSPAPDAPEERFPWHECLRVVMHEEVEHHRYLMRDLALLEGALSGG